jgi:predicted transcriptional regulator of viral defense system
MYRPSYISLHSSLSFYGLIPESVIQVTCVTTLKTSTFKNIFGEFSYRTIKPQGFFGYDHLPSANGRFVQMAKPEKALLDLLYLYPFYQSNDDFKNLRFDEYFLEEKLNIEQLLAYTVKFKNVALEKRVKTFLNTYNL